VSSGRLTVTGLGYRLSAQITPEAVSRLQGADRVFHLVDDAITAAWISNLNPRAEALAGCLRPGRPGHEAMVQMRGRILGGLREGHAVCLAFPGHPSILVAPGREIVTAARAERFGTDILPGISILDCLVADLRIDLGKGGLRLFEATDFVVRRREFDPSSPLVLLQPGMIGQWVYGSTNAALAAGLELLGELLSRTFPSGHEVILYHVPPYPVCETRIRRVRLAELAGLTGRDVTYGTTLFVPARG